MFTAAEYRLIREDCPKKLDSLLENLKIEKPTWNEGEEFEIYAKLDDEIISKLCEKMDSESIIDGYTKLMKLGNLHFDYSETDNELLATILNKREKIQECLQEKIDAYKKISALPPEVEPREFDYSKVKIEFSRADFEIGIPMPEKKLTLKERKILSFPQDLATQIKNLICDYLREKEPHNVIEAIEVSVKTKNGIYSVKSSSRPKNIARPESPPFTPDKLSDVVKSLNLVEDIIKSI